MASAPFLFLHGQLFAGDSLKGIVAGSTGFCPVDTTFGDRIFVLKQQEFDFAEFGAGSGQTNNGGITLPFTGLEMLSTCATHVAMCGRYALTSPSEIIAQRFGLLWAPEVPAHYNIAPSQMVPVVRESEQGGELVFLKWGLIPSWAKDATIGAKLINARAETLMDKPAFRNAYRRRHCLVPADAFYEWKAIGGRKQSYCIRMVDRMLFGMAGLWEHWVDPAGEAVETCTIVTTNANELVGQLHDRMPLIVQPSDYGAWLDSSSPKAQELLKPFPSERMSYYPVNPRVNNARNDVAACLEPVEMPAAG